MDFLCTFKQNRVYSSLFFNDTHNIIPIQFEDYNLHFNYAKIASKKKKLISLSKFADIRFEHWI